LAAGKPPKRLFWAQNKPFSIWINAAEHTAFEAVDGLHIYNMDDGGEPPLFFNYH